MKTPHEYAQSATGRLVLVIEETLSTASRGALRRLLADFLVYPDVTMVAGLSRASVLAAGKEGENVFYNTCDYLAPEQAFRMMPWREVWLVAAGKVWRASGV